MEGSTGRPVTMAHVALDAGVSIPTVSRVINGSAPVAPDTRLSVLRAIEHLGYHPNPMARGLSRGYSDTVLVILPHITEPSATLRLGGLIGVLRTSPYELHLVDLERPVTERVRQVGEIVLRNRPAGVVVISMSLDERDHQAFHDAGVPVVLVDSPSDEFPADTVDDVAGGEMATRHLIALGHRRIGFIGDREETTVGIPASADRRRGYQRAMAAARLEVRPDYVRTAPHGTETAAELAEQMLALTEPPSAIFAASDIQAFGVLTAARSARVRVPDQLSVIGFDDIFAASLMGLTTVRQPLEVSGRRAGLRLLQMLRHTIEEQMPELPPLELVVRNSTAPVLTAQEPLSTVSFEALDMATKVSSSLTSAVRQDQLVPRRK